MGILGKMLLCTLHITFLCVCGGHTLRAEARRLGGGYDVTVSDPAALNSMISGITSGRDPSWDQPEVCDWGGVECNGGYVTGVAWISHRLVGVLNLTVVPQQIEFIDVNNNALTGPILDMAMATLPPTLTRLDLSGNAFNASLDFEHLPPTLLSLNLPTNQFSGSPSFTSLPPTLKMDLSNNNFCGNISVSNVATMTTWNMCIGGINPVWHWNGGGGSGGVLSCAACSVDPQGEDLAAMLSLVSGFALGKDPSWSAATPACQWYRVACTNGIVVSISWFGFHLLGILNVTLLPRFTQYLQLYDNVFTDCYVVGWSTLSSYPLYELDLERNTGLFGNVDSLNLPTSLQALSLNNNNFTGTPQFFRLPELRYLDVGFNSFCGIIKTSNASRFVSSNFNEMCIDGVNATWIPELPAYVCPPCNGTVNRE